MANAATIAITHGNTPVKLSAKGAPDSTPGNTLALKNTGSVDAYVGGDEVTVAHGWPLPVDAVLVIDVDEDLYAVVAGGSDGQINVLRVR